MKRTALERRTPLRAKAPMNRKREKRGLSSTERASANHKRRSASRNNDKRHPIREAARGEHCTLNIVGACRYDTETTVLAHLPLGAGIMGGKESDLSGCFACSACHDVIDGRAKWPPMEGEHRDFYLRRAMVRTWCRLVEKGVISIKGAS
ncbi:DUF1364 family protein [Halomonas elongata]|uniref:nuclease domain-containing protein n=1 Tax=Halomonas elongata TaxID=2746 RepID=UPI00255A958E|nr:nuclease domain-containing protein [Halomonas elongata]MDL4862961.1 DUF1364 family protein [Halomonas elongata]